MKDILVDEQLKYLKQDGIIKSDGKIYMVGEDLSNGSSDEECAKFCLDHDCDFVTADKRAYDKFLKADKIQKIHITKMMKDLNIDRPVYLVEFDRI